ncbi:leucine-rich repeat domain-containing protein, partial [Candidatus Saccharibacteria bacterium]|nr:leucine-rich repeat domain-containing protein [Candidatus Saccharibacteria bacterium]
GNLTELYILNLAGNHISIIPPEIGNLTSLHTLSLDSNDISLLPPEIGKLECLEILSISYNPFNVLPDTFGNLTRLTHLDVDVNALNSIESKFHKLLSLTSLSLDGNSVWVSEGIRSFNNLTELHIYSSTISIPPDVALIKSLSVVIVYGNMPLDVLLREDWVKLLKALRGGVLPWDMGCYMLPHHLCPPVMTYAIYRTIPHVECRLTDYINIIPRQQRRRRQNNLLQLEACASYYF